MRKRARAIKPENALEGAAYVPYLKTHHFGSKGICSRTYNPELGRIQHTMSLLELRYLQLIKWTRPTDIREQFVLPLGATEALANELGLKHPTIPGTAEPHPVTTDFLVAWGRAESLALAVKPAHMLVHRRTMEKLHIEYEYWRREGVPWAIGTDRDLPEAAVHNIEWFGNATELHLESRLADAAEEILAARLSDGLPPVEAARQVDHALQLDPGTGLYLIRHFLATRRWATDMTVKVHPARPLEIHRDDQSREERAA